MYVHVRLVSRSHSGNLKMADPADVWDLPIKFFLFRSVGVALKPTKGTSR